MTCSTLCTDLRAHRCVQCIIINHGTYFKIVCVQPTQVEIVLLVFRRLAEDLHPQSNSASLSQLRKKEMSAALRERIRSVYQFMMQNIEVKYTYMYIIYSTHCTLPRT